MKNIIIDAEAIRISASHASKGNQLKWKIGNYWYKADCYGYEALAEIVVSEFLMQSNLNYAEFVRYEPIKIEYRGREFNGCFCENFLKEDESLLSLDRVYYLYYAIGLTKRLGKTPEIENRILNTVEEIERVTGIDGFGVYLSKLLELDAFFLNEDRHTNNISLIYTPKREMFKFSLSPFYDFGASLFSDTLGDYPIDEGSSLVEMYEKYINMIEAKPFSRDFDAQLDVVQQFYGSHLKFNLSREAAINLYYSIVKEKHLDEMYSRDVIERVAKVLRMQIRKYDYLFVK